MIFFYEIVLPTGVTIVVVWNLLKFWILCDNVEALCKRVERIDRTMHADKKTGIS